MKKYITTLLGLVLAFSASVQAETLDELVAKLTPDQKNASKITAIYTEARNNPTFYDALKNADWTFEGVKLPAYYQMLASLARKDWDAISPDYAAKQMDPLKYRTWVAGRVSALGDTIAAYDWLQAQRLALLGVNDANTPAKVEFVDALAAQILAAAKARGN